MQIIDVKELEMPKPMLTILDSLDNLPSETALFVYHEKNTSFFIA